MPNIRSEILDHYDIELTKLISQKYGYDQLSALRKFLNSQTYKMLSNFKLEMWDFSPLAIFDMWEVEQISGNPRNSLYLRGDEYAR